MKRRQTRKPRATLHKDGTMTISGLNYQDARSLVTAAANHMYDVVEKKGNSEWSRKMQWICQALDADILRCIKATHPNKPGRELSLKERLLKNKQERDLLDQIINAAIAAG